MGNHWYDTNGCARHTVMGANGKERSTTLRDARTMNLLPSVTTILGILDKPGLNKWRVDEHLKTVWDTHEPFGDDFETWADKVREATEEQLRLKPELGTNIHAAIEAWVKDEPFAVEYEPYVYAARSALATLGIPKDAWKSEVTRAWPKLGYAGTIDLHCVHNGRRIVLDFKSKGFTRLDSKGKERTAKDVTWPEMVMQLGAYGYGLFDGEQFEAYNVMLSTDEPGHWLLRAWEQEDVAWGIDAFANAAAMWRTMNRYDPRG